MWTDLVSSRCKNWTTQDVPLWRPALLDEPTWEEWGAWELKKNSPTEHRCWGAPAKRSEASGEREQRREWDPGRYSPPSHCTQRWQEHHFPFLSLEESQSRPSYRPSPPVAHVAWMYQSRLRRVCRPSLSVTSAASMALGRSWRSKKTQRSINNDTATDHMISLGYRWYLTKSNESRTVLLLPVWG